MVFADEEIRIDEEEVHYNIAVREWVTIVN